MPKNQSEPPKERKRPSEEIALGTDDMQDAIEKVRQMSNRKKPNSNQDVNTNKRKDQAGNKKYDKNDPEELKESIWRRTMSNEDGERLYELTELGLSMDAARELREQEKTLQEVYKMLEDKKRKSTVRAGQSESQGQK